VTRPLASRGDVARSGAGRSSSPPFQASFTVVHFGAEALALYKNVLHLLAKLGTGEISARPAPRNVASLASAAATCYLPARSAGASSSSTAPACSSAGL